MQDTTCMDAGQESVESNHKRAANACNGIDWAIQEETRKEVDSTVVRTFTTYLKAQNPPSMFIWGPNYTYIEPCSHAGSHIPSYRQLQVKDLPKVLRDG